MNKKTIWIVIAVLLILAAGWAAMSGRNKNQSFEKQEKANSGLKQTSLKELEGLASPQKCTFKDESSPEQVQGLVYISKGKMRGDFAMTSQGKTIKSHMISDDKYAYNWTDDSASGFKVSLDVQKNGNNPGAGSPGSAKMDFDKQMSYDCQSWSEDASVFAPPSHIKFEDFSSLIMPQVQQDSKAAPTPPGSNASACATCDSLQGDARTQCRTALSCN